MLFLINWASFANNGIGAPGLDDIALLLDAASAVVFFALLQREKAAETTADESVASSIVSD